MFPNFNGARNLHALPGIELLKHKLKSRNDKARQEPSLPAGLEQQALGDTRRQTHANAVGANDFSVAGHKWAAR